MIPFCFVYMSNIASLLPMSKTDICQDMDAQSCYVDYIIIVYLSNKCKTNQLNSMHLCYNYYIVCNITFPLQYIYTFYFILKLLF